MDLGKFSISLTVKNLQASRTFYETLGFEVSGGAEDQNYLMLRHGDAIIGLFQDMFDQNILTFNPTDVRAIQKKLKDAGIKLHTEVEGDEGPGAMMVLDPDGNPILVDQHPDASQAEKTESTGKVTWVDLTVDDAGSVRDFYAAVVGWESAPVNQGEYDDYNMLRDGTPATGICHKRGGNKDIPSKWMVYFTVSDFDASLQKVTELGGKIIVPARGEAGHRFVVIEDPAGAVCALYESPS